MATSKLRGNLLHLSVPVARLRVEPVHGGVRIRRLTLCELTPPLDGVLPRWRRTAASGGVRAHRIAPTRPVLASQRVEITRPLRTHSNSPLATIVAPTVLRP